MTIAQIRKKVEILHDEMLIEFQLVRTELSLILDISAVTFLFPIHILTKFVGSVLSKRNFYFSVSDLIDIFVFLMILSVW